MNITLEPNGALNLHHMATTCNLLKPRAHAAGSSRSRWGCKCHILGSWMSVLVPWTRSLC